MFGILIHWVLTALVLLIISKVIPGVVIEGFFAALVAALVMGLINISIKPLVMLLTLPVNILTLGLFALVINALMFSLTAWVVPGFEVTNFWSAFFGALLLALMTALLGVFDNRVNAT